MQWLYWGRAAKCTGVVVQKNWVQYGEAKWTGLMEERGRMNWVE